MRTRFRRPIPVAWIGYQGKTLWDWVQLLLLPSLLSGAALLFNERNARTQLSIASDAQYESALQDYIDAMSGLLLDADLRASAQDSEPRTIARTRTVAVLRAIDTTRRRTVLEFLQETRLISATDALISMNAADLSGVDLQNANLAGLDLAGAKFASANLRNAEGAGSDFSGADFSGADMESADMESASFQDADFANANLRNADFTGADLAGANFTNANLTGATVTDEQLATVRALSGATLPDGSTGE